MTKRCSVQETLWWRCCRSKHSKDEAGQSCEWSTVNDDLKRMPTRRLLRATIARDSRRA